MERRVIQGGMGIYISHPFLAKACGMAGALGTVSCTGAERVLANLLGLGDLGGHYRRALEHFPVPEVAERVIAKYYIEGGKPEDENFRQVPVWSLTPRRDIIELAVVASFAFVWLAKEGHDNPISVNYLEKIQWHPYHLAGAMLAGVDYVTMGAGITLQIPSVLDALASGETATYRVSVEKFDGGYKTVPINFNPREFFGECFPKTLKRPGFLPIVSTDVLAKLMVSKLPTGSIQGFIIELPTAGGHNAPPRKKGVFDETGQPVYGEKDKVDWEALKDLGIPFWIGGSFASPEGLVKAISLGASGIQAGTIFALCEDSGMDPFYRAKMRRLGFRNELDVFTDPEASPTGFPFKVPRLKGTLSEPEVYMARKRECKISALQFACELPDGKIVFRCASEPIADYVRKGGKAGDTVGHKCLCYGLFGAAHDKFSGKNLVNPGQPPIFTLGDDVSFLKHLMADGNSSYTAPAAFEWLMSQQNQ